MALAGSITRILAQSPSRSMARKNVPGALPHVLQQIGRAEEQVQRMAEHALADEADAERVADRAGGAVAADQIVGDDRSRAPVSRSTKLRRDARAGVLERFELGAIAQLHRRRRTREVAQDRIEPHLRAGLQAHRAVALRRLLSARRPRHAAELMAAEAGDEHHVERIVGRERAVQHLAGDAPAPAELHGADVHLVHLRRGDRAIVLLDQKALHAAPAEIGGECKSDRPAADDQDRNLAHRNVLSSP